MMPTELTAVEAFEFAERIERDSADIYRRAAEVATDGQARDLLLDMARTEVRHGEVLTEIRRGLNGGATVVESLDQRSREMLPVLADMAVSGAWQDLASQLRAEKTNGTLLASAIDFEKDSIIFYSQLRHAVRKLEDKDRIDRIIREELEHVAALAGDLTRRTY